MKTTSYFFLFLFLFVSIRRKHQKVCKEDECALSNMQSFGSRGCTAQVLATYSTLELEAAEQPENTVHTYMYM